MVPLARDSDGLRRRAGLAKLAAQKLLAIWPNIAAKERYGIRELVFSSFDTSVMERAACRPFREK
jgi:hypothetical protein